MQMRKEVVSGFSLTMGRKPVATVTINSAEQNTRDRKLHMVNKLQVFAGDIYIYKASCFLQVQGRPGEKTVQRSERMKLSVT